MVHREQCVDFALQEPDVCVWEQLEGGVSPTSEQLSQHPFNTEPQIISDNS